MWFELFWEGTACLYFFDGVSHGGGGVKCLFGGYLHTCGSCVECSVFDLLSLLLSGSDASECDVCVWELFFGVCDDGGDVVGVGYGCVLEWCSFGGSEYDHDEG